ncbi:nuclear transport factor 2 family protein [Thermocatellispora tengchongensis]|uniref:nuclear transport factor 2 family protein n=1 Tax=Thermocatellispora tengchongensis TaxID=1073253 RepID=UPI00362D6D58
MQAQELLDRDEITRLVYRLGVVLDEGRFDEMPSIFTEDATVHTPGGLAKGRDALTAQAQRTHSPGERIQHVVGNVLIDLDGDRADVRANLVVTFATGNPRKAASPPPPASRWARSTASRRPAPRKDGV